MLYLLSISGVQESDGLPDGSFQQCHEVTNLPEAAGLANPLGKWMPPSVSPSSAPAALGRAVYIGPITYKGQAAVQRDIENFRAALAGVHVEEAFLPAAPTMVQYGSRNEYYPSDEAYVYALADALQEEYNAMVNAGFLLQIDAPELPATAGGSSSAASIGLPKNAPNISSSNCCVSSGKRRGDQLGTAREPGNGTGKGIRDLCRLLVEESIA
jgi:hypothetical protein